MIKQTLRRASLQKDEVKDDSGGGCKSWDASFSSMWAMGNYTHLEDFFTAARGYGFAKIELNHQVNSAMLAGIELERFHFSSIHEPCPADISTETLKARDWLISATDEGNRRQGVAVIQQSIDLAAQLGAEVVVVHAGIIPVDQALERSLSALYTTGRNQSPEYCTLKERLENTRASVAKPRLEAARKSLGELVAYACRFNIRLGLENRYHYMDIPGLEEMEILLGTASPDQLGLVFDVGHAQTLDRLGFYPFEEWLERYASRIIGVHLHDIIGINDHFAPGLGEVDFNRVATYLPQEAFRTCELKASNTPEQVKAGLKFLIEKGCVKCL